MQTATPELFGDMFAAPTPRSSAGKPQTARREHAGGIPRTAWESGEIVPVEDLNLAASEAEPELVADVAKAMASRALVGLVEWLESPYEFIDGAGNISAMKATQLLRCRMMILKLYLAPDSFGETVPTQQQLSARLGVNPSTLSRVATDFSRRFGVMARFQARAETKFLEEETAATN